MAEEASSSYRGRAADVLGPPLKFTFQAGQVEQPQPRQGGKHAKPHKHSSPFRKPPEDKPFPSFPASPAPAMNGMHPGSTAASGSAASASSSAPSPALPRSLESAFNGMHAGTGAKSGDVSKAASSNAAAQLPPRFASVVNVSKDSAATPAAAQQRRPNTAARTGPRTAARRRANLRTPGGAVGTPGGASPFLREGSPMDWSPSFPEPAAPKAADEHLRNGAEDVARSKPGNPSGVAEDHLSDKDDVLDGLHADLAASSLSGDGNKQQAQLSEAFSSSFNLGSHPDSQAGQPPAQPASESATAPKPKAADGPGVSAAQNGSAPPLNANHTAHGSTATSQSEADVTTEKDHGKQKLGEELAAKFAELTAQWKARPDAASDGRPGQNGQSQSATSQATASMPGAGSVGGESAGGRSLSDDSSADSGLPRGVMHHGSSDSPAEGRRARISHLSQAAKQMKEARHHIRVDTRPGMTLKDFQAAAKAHASRKAKAGSARMHVDHGTASNATAQAAETVAANGQANGFMHPFSTAASASDKGQAWRSYQSSQTDASQDSISAEGSSRPQAASSGNPAGRSRPATADLDEYLSRQHPARSNAPTDSMKASGPSASAAEAPSLSAQRGRPSSAGNASHAASFSAAQPSHAKQQADVHDVTAPSLPAGTSAGTIHAAEQAEQVDASRPTAAGTIPAPQAEAGTRSFTFTFGQQTAGSHSENQPGSVENPPTSQSGVNFEAPPAAEASTAGKAERKAQRTPKRSTAETFRPGSPAPIFMFSSPATKPSQQQPSVPSTSPTSFTFGAVPTTATPKQQPTAQGSSSAWPNAGFKQPQPTFTASASQASYAGFSSAAPAGQNVSGGSAASWPKPGTSFMPQPPMSFPGFNAQTSQQGQAPAHKEPVFTFGQQPEPQPAALGGPAAQQQPDPGSARARGLTFGLGSQNVPPTQNSARPSKGRSGRHAAKAATPHAAKHQPHAAAPQNGPAYSQPGPRMSIPVRCSNHFESPVQGTPAASGRYAPAADAAHNSPEQDVERLRQRGNDAFQRGNYNRAADLYTRAIKQQVQLGVTEGLGKLYSNLAACFLQQEHFSKAIQACQLALQAEPGFHKASIRLATCQMRLGDAAAAKAALEADPRLQTHADVAAKLAEIKAHGSRISAAISAADSAQSTSAVEAALAQVDALLQPDQAPGSQDLQRLKHQLQLQLSRFEDAAGACQPRRFPSGKAPPDWHWWLTVQAAFHSGELSHAADLLSTQITAASPWGASPPGLAIGAWKGAADGAGQQLGTGHAQEILGSMQRMLKLKEAGNSALKASQAQQAVEHYSKALQLQHPPSIPFAAVLHANRAAARQSLRQHAEAIADCLRATALKPDYAKAHSRLAALLMDLKHNNRAVDVLERLDGLVKGSSLESADVARRLRDARLGARFDAADHYKLLGVDRTVCSEDVRRAYKKSALQLHPDKALTQCRFSLRLGDQGLELCSRSETEQRVRDNADWLFKCIAEAHTTLTDPTERQELDSGLARQERHQRARAGSYRASPTSRRPAQSPYASYTSKTYGSHSGHRYKGEPEAPSWEDYDDDYVPYSSSRWNYY